MKNIFKLLVVFVFLFNVHRAAAQTGPFYTHNYGSEMSAYNQALDTVIDPMFETLIHPDRLWRNDYINHTSYNLIKLFVDDANTSLTTAFNYEFYIKITKWDETGAQSTEYITMPLSYNPAQYETYKDVAVYRFRGAHKFTSNIISVKDLNTNGNVSFSSLKKKFGFYQEIVADRYAKSSYDEIVSPSHIQVLKENGKIKFNWEACAPKAPTWFDLEWMFVDDYGGNKQNFIFDNTIVHQTFNKDGDLLGWQKGAGVGDLEVADGTFNIMAGGRSFSQNFDVKTGKKYRVYLSITHLAAPNKINVIAYGSSLIEAIYSSTNASGTTVELDFTATENEFFIGIENDGSSVCKIDDIKVVDVTYEPSGDEYFIHPSALHFSFKNNATRVRLSEPSYFIDDVFEHGYVLYRVRRVRVDSVYRVYEKLSPWSSTMEAGLVEEYHDFIQTESHSDDVLNWNYQVSYAEEGRRKDVVGYYDGLLKPRQQVAVSNAENTVIVGESKYDFNGRAAVQILPVPVVINDSTYDNRLKYYSGFNKNLNDVPYSASDFDSLVNICPSDSAGKLSTTSGASLYYSSNNPDKNGHQKYVPDAEMYPMVHTEFMPDNTGRIRRQGGVGAHHQLGSGHESFYHYSQPRQHELDRLFGSEVGFASHYKKQTITDANGQISVSYTDIQGRTIATALSEQSPVNMEAIPENRPADLMFSNLSRFNVLDESKGELSLVYEHTLNKTGPVYIDYRMRTSAFNEACLPLNLCFKCVYDYEIMLINKECNEVVFYLKDTIGLLNPMDTLCDVLHTISLVNHIDNLVAQNSLISLPENEINDTTIVINNLSKGTYSLSKRLTINKGAADLYFDTYKDRMNCIKTFDEFFKEALDSTDFSDCDNCDSCEVDEDLGYCDAMLLLMKSDVTPGGQYCGFTTDENGNVEAINDNTSVLKNGRYSSIKGYATNGVVDIITFSDGTLDSAYKASIQDFVINFKSSWADSLVKFHPEYPYYLYCRDSLTESYAYDFVRMSQTNYDSAYKYGYLNPTGLTGLKTPFPSHVTGRDPYFYNNPHLKDQLNNKLLKYKVLNGEEYSIWDLAALMTFCNKLHDEYEIYPCLESFRNEKIVNPMFYSEVLKNSYVDAFNALYNSAKQDIVESRLKYSSNIYANVTYNYPNCFVGTNSHLYGSSASNCAAYETKIRRFYFGNNIETMSGISIEDIEEEPSVFINSVEENDSISYYFMLDILSQLNSCPFIPSIASVDYKLLQHAILNLCHRGRIVAVSPTPFPTISLPSNFDFSSTPMIYMIDGVIETTATLPDFLDLNQLLNYFFDTDSIEAGQMIECSRYIVENTYSYSHSFNEEPEDDCKCINGSKLVAPKVQIKSETKNVFRETCLRDTLLLSNWGRGLWDLINELLPKGDSLRGSPIGNGGYTKNISQHTSYNYYLSNYYDTYMIGTKELKRNYKGAFGSNSLHQWRISFVDTLTLKSTCNVFLELNELAATTLFAGSGPPVVEGKMQPMSMGTEVVDIQKGELDTFYVVINGRGGGIFIERIYKLL